MNHTETFIPKGMSIKAANALIDQVIEYHESGGVFAAATYLPAGQCLVQHKHKHDHLSIVAKGRVLLDVNGVQSEHSAGECITVKAGFHHGVKALDDAIWYCLVSENEETDHFINPNHKGVAEVYARLKGE